MRSVLPLAKLNSGYHSDSEDWARFLDCWHEKLATSFEKTEVAYRPMWPTAKVGARSNREAIAAAIRQTETRLEKNLPRSYRDFLLASGGSFLFGLNQVEPRAESQRSNFWPPDKIGLFKLLRPGDWQTWRKAGPSVVDDEVYYRYGFRRNPDELQDSVRYRAAHLDHVVYVGEFYGEAFLLLNPLETTADGEWEAWELSWKAPGAIRYRSFAEMLQNIHVADAMDPPHGEPYPAELLRASCARLISSAALEEGRSD